MVESIARVRENRILKFALIAINCIKSEIE